MPIIKPEVQRILAKAGLVREGALAEGEESLTIEENLDSAGLDNISLAEQLSALALHSGNDALRLRAIETALKIKGALKEQPQAIPSFTIIIQNSPGGGGDKTIQGVNPILFPRQSLSQTPGTRNSEQQSGDTKPN